MKITTTSSPGTIAVTLDNDVPETSTVTQFGMLYPDGSVKWAYDHDAYSIGFEDIANGRISILEDWNKRLDRRAREAMIDPETYADGHTLLRRSIIVVTTKAEEVSQ